MTKMRGGIMTDWKRKANARRTPPAAVLKQRKIQAGFWKKKTG